MRAVTFLLTLACLGLSGLTHAAQRNDVPSCYGYAGMSAYQPAPTGRELVVVIDQTTPLTTDLRRTALNAALRFVQPGDEVMIYQFSAYMADSYMRLPFEGRMEAPIGGAQRDEIGMESLRKLDRCLGQQQAFFAKLFTSKFDASIGTASTHIAKSEIMRRKRAGEAIPEGWAFGPDGAPTTDPAIALQGTMAPSGGYKGVGIALLVEILAAAASGASTQPLGSSIVNIAWLAPVTFRPSIWIGKVPVLVKVTLCCWLLPMAPGANASGSGLACTVGSKPDKVMRV